MASLKTRRAAALAGAVVSTALILAGCADDDDGGGGSAGGTWPGEDKAECADLEQLSEFGDLSGREVGLYTSIVAPEDQSHKDSYELFTTCTGADVKYEGSKEFEAQLPVRVQAGNPPDVAYIPQPGLLKTLVATGKVVEAPEATAGNVDEFFGEDWKAYGTVDGTFYAAPLGANVKSFVWYSPSMFAENGWEVPQTWDDLIALSDTIAGTGIKPWCAGIESGEATGWPATDWLEDVLLRTAGADVYDQWVNHEIPFDDAAVAEALDEVGSILKNEDYVNGGIGNVDSIATTAFQDGGLPILDGECALHRQAGFYAANWPEGTNVAEDGDAFAFYLPTKGDEFGRPVLGGGEFVAAFSDAAEVQAFQTYLSSAVWANEKAKATPGGGWVSANTGLDIANLVSPIDQLSAETFQDSEAVFRFDGSDQMPGEVGANSFWKEMTAWITGRSTEEALANIEQSWPEPHTGATSSPARLRRAGAGSPGPPECPEECTVSPGEKFVQLVICVAVFFGVVAVILLLTSRLRSRTGERIQFVAFVLPALALIAIGLLYPAVNTIYQSFKDNTGAEFVGFDNYHTVFTNTEQLRVLRNTALWVVIVPTLSTFIGLVYAVLVDRARMEKFAKALVFLPMAISLVGASIIWRFVYDYKDKANDQIGLANQVLKSLGMDTYNFLLNEPWNNLFLIVIMIWVQAGFAMTILSASIKAIPEDIVEAARLDGVGGLRMFRYITIPSIRPSLIVVLTTISITTLKAFDIVRTATGGNFETSVLAYEFYVQSFRSNNAGLGAALAVLIFVLVLPIVVYNIRQMRKVEAR